MRKPLLGEKIAVLVANGFCESDLTGVQKALLPLGAEMRIISMDHGLVNSWNDDNWGLNFAADNVLSAALAADFSMLIIPGGQRSVEKLKLTAHTRRFIGGFMDTGKPVVAMGDALDLLVFAEKLVGHTVTGPAALSEAATAAGAEWAQAPSVTSANLLTGPGVDAEAAAFTAEIVQFLVAAAQAEAMVEAA